jgi:hypothetical protein
VPKRLQRVPKKTRIKTLVPKKKQQKTKSQTMDFLMGKFMEYGASAGFSGIGGGGDKKDKKDEKKSVFYQSDVRDFVKFGAIGFLAMGIYQIGMRVAKRNINPCVDLLDRADSLSVDPIILDSFVNIQSYRDLNPWLFRTALQNVDRLLFLENALLSKQVHATSNDKAISFSYFRMSIIRLNQLQLLVKEKLGNEHALACNIFVQKIYFQMQKHFLNVLHLCSDFKPEFMIARAKSEVDRAVKKFKENKKYESSWSSFVEKKEHSRSQKSNRSRPTSVSGK